MELLTPLETLCRLILRAREMEAQVPRAIRTKIRTMSMISMTRATRRLSVLEDELNNGVEEEIARCSTISPTISWPKCSRFAWVGRGTYDASEWDDAFEEANDLDAGERDRRTDGHAAAGGHLEAGTGSIRL